METPYACYLQLPDLLGLQRPRTPDDQSAQWADERLFITVHQSAELLVSQALVDLKRASQQARHGHGPAAMTGLRRVTAVICLLEDHLALLDHLTPESFASFRPLLDNASGAQSSQFVELFQQITAPDCPSTSNPDPGTTPGAHEAGERELAEEFRALRSAVTRWWTRHLLLVERMIGNQVGTAGTSGLAYLRSQIDLPPHATHD
ncbi:tryptophan 2,3-dioxygenase family protein [Streptomyces albidochromogenes]|uniref:Tryptophan 2,3-dioxygenase family protein n=1 Tax=Streptomyces albidochromogenes TaxID=329524 RepID=A0ABW6FUJ0_9ACTN